jgi:formylglycine-generating enzyme required for sulfatase activity
MNDSPLFTRRLSLGISVFIMMVFFVTTFATPAHPAEVKNTVARQEGNRVVFEYDLMGEPGESETEVIFSLIVEGKTYGAKDLHLEGDVGKVRVGKGKKLYWNVLQDFPRGYRGDLGWEILAGGKQFKDPVTGMELVFVKGGCFKMGDTFGDGGSDEKPIHEVCVSDFFIGKYEVTQRQWKAIMGDNPSLFKDCGDSCPVERVSWNDVQKFTQQLNQKTGKPFRLPTEAEWEYAARSGGKNQKYAGTNDNLDDYAWYTTNSWDRTHPVGQKKPNSLGLYDMSGNVWEWVADWYREKYYSQSPRSNPTGPTAGSERVLRGGGWYHRPHSVRVTHRYWFHPDYNVGGNVGFRLALSGR